MNDKVSMSFRHLVIIKTINFRTTNSYELYSNSNINIMSLLGIEL